MLQVEDQTGGGPPSADGLVPGQPLHLTPEYDERRSFTCSVVEVEEGRLWIDLPVRRGAVLSLFLGDRVLVRVDHGDEAVDVFDTAICAVRELDEAPFAIGRPELIVRRPRRRDLRVDLVADASYVADAGRGRGRVVDVSAGGLALICDGELDEGAQLTVRCSLPTSTGFLTLSEPAVVRSAADRGLTPAGRPLHQYGLAFTEDDPARRARLGDCLVWNLARNQ